ncbi:MAG: hypothetical protein IJL78_04065 [Lachnospiraceae bacterium]|nr:hypothetical protein [Lachnospiraceae bacterium]
MKQVLGKIFGRYLPLALAFVSVPLLLWITWVQTLGFELVGVVDFLMVFLVSIFLGIITIRFARRKQHGRLKDLKGMLIGDTVCLILCLILCYMAGNVAFYYLALFGTGFCLGNLWYYFFWEWSEKKAAAAAEAEAAK